MTAKSLLIIAFLSGCGATTAKPSPTPSPAPAAVAPLTLVAVAQEGDGFRVQADDGRRFSVHHPRDWPIVLSEDHGPAGAIAAGGRPDYRVTTYSMADPFVATMIASLQRARGPAVDPAIVAPAVRRLTVAPLVMDSNWSNTMLTHVVQTGPSSFDLEILKHGVPLAASVGRSASLTSGASGYEHVSQCGVEGRSFDAEALAKILEQGGLGPRATPAMRAEVIALLRRPTSRTSTPAE